MTRFDKADSDKKEEYLKQFKEARRVVLKVGRKEDIKAMNEIKKDFEKIISEIDIPLSMHAINLIARKEDATIRLPINTDFISAFCTNQDRYV